MSKSSEEKKHITRISAKSGSNTKVSAPVAEPEKSANTKKEDQKSTIVVAKKAKRLEKEQKAEKSVAKTKKSSDDRKPIREVKLFARPFVAFGRYVRDSWQELRLVRWPDRKATWKMTLAVLVYCAIMMIFILLLDTLFTFLFNLAFK